MSEAAKAARAANKAKADRLTAGDPKAKVDASSYTPPEMMNTEAKTGLRPVSRRAYKSGGKVHGEMAVKHAGRKPRKSGGATEIANAKVNRNVKEANAEKFGKPHTGGYAMGGYAKGGRPAKLEGGTVSRYRDKAYDEMQDAENAKASRRGDRTVAKNADAIIRRRAKGIEMAERRLGDDEYKRGGRAKKMDGGPMGDPRAAAAAQMADAATQAGVPAGRMSFTDRAGSPLPNSGMKKGGKIKNFEGSPKDEMQDKKLAKKRGMSMQEWEASEADEKHDKQQSMAGLKKGGRTGRATGGRAAKSTGGDILKALSPISMLMNKGGKAGDGFNQGTRPTGGRIAKAGGGLLSSLMGGSKAPEGKSKGKKKGTNINIVINAGKSGDQGMPTAPPILPAPPMLPPTLAGAMPGGGAPMGMPMPDAPDMSAMGAPGGGMPGGMPGLPGRKAGGRVGHRSYSSYKDMDAGSGGGLGRLEKTEIAKKKYK